MNAYFDVHLEGQQVEGKIINVPVQYTPHWLPTGHRVSTRVAVGGYPRISIVFSLN